jgi:hypothetical protein
MLRFLSARLVFGAVLAIGVAGPGLAEPAIVGLSTDQLIACAGFPSNQMQTQAAEYWQYGTSHRSGSVLNSAG